MRKYIVFQISAFLLLAFAYSAGIQAQVNPNGYSTYDYTQKKTYNIGGIEIEGAKSRDPNAIKSIAKLREGRQITIPGDDVPNAIKSLLRLGLFEDVKIMQEDLQGDLIFLKIVLVDRPTLSRYSIEGEPKNKHSSLTDIIDRTVSKGSIVTEDLKNLLILKLQENYIEKGFLDAKVTITEKKDEVKDNAVRLIFNIDKKERVKIANINILGNRKFNDKKLKKQLSDTKQKGTFLKKSKFVKTDYEVDKKNLINFYNKNGYRDAVITEDTLWRSFDGSINMELTIDEGNQYYFRDIKWKGNSKYSSEYLSSILGISKGDVYDPELLETRLSFSLDGRDISSLYLDDGYLFFSVDPVEVSVKNDSIDLEMQMYEGAQATIANVNIFGNDRTHEHVIRRELRTEPGDKFSRTNIIRTQRAVTNLGYFNPETFDIQTPVNQANGTVDINYTVEETPSDQLELSAGYGGQSNGLIGTLGVTFNNFSLANIKDKSTWSPLPQGDGQKLSVRGQSNGSFFQSYNLSFTEPWLGGKRPTSFSAGIVHSAFNQEFFGQGKLSITRGFVGLGTQLKKPDDFFSINATLSLERIRTDGFGGFFAENPLVPGEFQQIRTGNFKNFNFNVTLSRSSVSEPIYPRRGSRVSLSVQFTPVYSIFRSDNFWVLNDAERASAIAEENGRRGSGNLLTDSEADDFIAGLELANRFEFLEYHKWRFNAEWYFNIFSKFVLATNIKMGFLGGYNSDIGISPFERYEVGGDGLSNQNAGITGKDIISLRGYEVEDLPENNIGGGTIFNKFTMELRYPLSLNPGTSIYVHSFVQGGNTWNRFSDFNPFEVQRSAGFGLRVFLPAFGLLGFDYGWGFDKNITSGGFGQFNIVLGFEPE
jgi:outer membrane protein insertion porin family